MTETASFPARRHPGRSVALLAVLLAAAPWPAGAQQQRLSIEGYVTVTSDYRHRGLSESLGRPSLQIAGDFQHRSGLFAGAWAAQIQVRPNDGDYRSGRYKIAYYAGYARRLSRWSWNASVLHYAYPGSAFDYDYDEISGTLAYRDRLFASASYVDDLFAEGRGWYGEVGIAQPLPFGLALDATIGRLDGSLAAYTHWNVGLSRRFARHVLIDVRRHETNRYYSNAVATSDGDAWVVSASYAFGGR